MVLARPGEYFGLPGAEKKQSQTANFIIISIISKSAIIAPAQP